MSKDSIYILLRNNCDIQVKHEKEVCFENNQVEGRKKPTTKYLFLVGRGGIIIKRENINIYYFEAKNKWKLTKMVTCEEREKIGKKLAFLENTLFCGTGFGNKVQKNFLIEIKIRQI